MEHPFGDDYVDEIPLQPAPLVMVVAQLRFPPMVSLTSDQSVAAFQDAVRGDYPIMERQEFQPVTVTPGGSTVGSLTTNFQFEDLDSSWKVTLAQDFLSLQTDQYTKRADFIDRLERAFIALNGVSDPSPVAVFDRLGVRFVNRLLGEDATYEQLNRWLNESVFGPLVLAESLVEGQELVASVAHQQFKLGEHMLNARWALLPPDGQLAPDVAPADETSWVLDIDASVDSRAPFQPSETAAVARRCAEYAYGAFRWIMSQQFIDDRRVSQ